MRSASHLGSDLDLTPDPALAPDDALPRRLIRGQAPPVLTLPDLDQAVRWWDGFVATYLERDLRQLSQVESLPDFRQVMRALALRSGQLANQTEIARDVKVSQPTVHRYLGLLETSMVLTRLPAFAVNRTKRLIKTPEVYWTDPRQGCQPPWQPPWQPLPGSPAPGQAPQSIPITRQKNMIFQFDSGGRVDYHSRHE